MFFLNPYNYAYNLSILLNGDRDERARARVHEQQWSEENHHVINQAVIVQ